ncbi:transcriptional regulator [Pseudidiomarina gelatinasegens]|jgi:putative transcriptional regulator|uniref:Transcriptional regulator n=1 Tax=Pseudidiomarina gelatinasegens TaxID=2487740 RepID=A0A443YZ56_9GAMM|nr:helix-turn-helix transcriptional regulator [Pseudidiomarina gelatinasegens]RWU09467.1 transcriptional regulator [Pseudidiomarina gelatinasegens]
MDEQVLNNLPAFRAQYGLSQQDLADAIGVSRKTISTIETRRFTPSVVIALKLANYFNVPVETIFSLSSN